MNLRDWNQSKKRPTVYADELSIDRTEALTKDQHDAIVEEKGRPVTQTEMRRRYRAIGHPDGPGVTSGSAGTINGGNVK